MFASAHGPRLSETPAATVIWVFAEASAQSLEAEAPAETRDWVIPLASVPEITLETRVAVHTSDNTRAATRISRVETSTWV